MSVIVFGSAKASPGVTTSVVTLAAAWPPDRDVLVIEADPDGGVIAARHARPSNPGLSTFAVHTRRHTVLTEADLRRHLQPFAGDRVSVLLAPPAAEQARRAVELAAVPLASTLPDLPGTDVLVDIGRLRPNHPASPLIEIADAVLLVARPRLEELQHLHARVRALRDVTRRLGILLIGDKPYPPAEVATTLDTEVAAVLADDPKAVKAVNGQAKRSGLEQSPLIRSAYEAVDRLSHGLQQDVARDPPTTYDRDRFLAARIGR